MKRVFDIIVSFLGLLAIAPLLLIIAIMIKLESKGPVFYRCQHAGRYGKPFEMLKFRTMVNNADDIDCKICWTGDVRVTRLGRILRRTKFNELPQLINVFLGEMSLVGPRPEDPKFLKYYIDEWDVVLQATPGIVGVNQIINRNEEDLFSACVDRENFYITKILPEKLRRDIEYVNNRTFSQDLELLVKGFWTSVVHAINREYLIKSLNLLGLVWIDIIIAWISYATAEYLRFESLFPDGNASKYLSLIMVINPSTFVLLGVYRLSDRFFSVPEYWRLVKAVSFSTILLAILSSFWTGPGHSRLVLFSYWILLLGGIAGKRLAVRLLYEHGESKKQQSDIAHKMIIYGAGRTGVSILSRLKFEPGIDLIGFVDDDSSLKGRLVLGVEVLGTGEDLCFLQALHGIEKAIIAFKGEDFKSLVAAGLRCLKAGIREISFHNAFHEFTATKLDTNNSALGYSESVKNGVIHKNDELRLLVEGTTVAIVTDGGEVGETLYSELMSMHVARIVVLENYHSPLRKMSDFKLSPKNSESSPLGYSGSSAANAETERVFDSSGARWVVYNRSKNLQTAGKITR